MAIGIVSLLVLAAVVIIGIPILARVFSEAAKRGQNEDEQNDRRGDGERDSDDR